MIQIVFTDNGKVHTVTFSGDEYAVWANRFTMILMEKELEYEWNNLDCVVYKD